jgi:endogenous inhibitor of DNA gyrase (YacG/DUF329 family)
MAAPSAVCPTCNNAFDPVKARAASATTLGPFCSARCRQVDLGKWLNEEYRVPVEDDGSEEGRPREGGEPS